VVNQLVGTWLAQPLVDTCDGSVMSPLSCAGAVSPDPTLRQAVADRFVPQITVAFAGDIHGERHIATAVNSGNSPLQYVAPRLAAADLAIVNLETPLSVRGSPANKRYVFRGPPAMAGTLVDAGVDIATLANNHALDYGVTALADTLQHAADVGLQTVGAGLDAASAYAPVVHDTPAGTVAVIGLTRVLHTRTWEARGDRPGLASAYDEPAAVAAVQAARASADHVVVAIHWGTERADCPDASQRHLARLLSQAGADLIVGHHPHVLQGVQDLGGALVAYSMGNFVWYHNSAPSRFTGILEVKLPLLDDPSWTFVPAEIGSDGAPRLAGGTLGESIAGRVTSRSPGGSLGCGFP
jgi:poly-gamma-glutamate synthesis protein (capsule biosynthesis protein)